MRTWILIGVLVAVVAAQSPLKAGRWSKRKGEWKFECPPGQSIARIQHKQRGNRPLRLKFKCRKFVPAGVNVKDVVKKVVVKAAIKIQEKGAKVQFGNIISGSVKGRVLVGFSAKIKQNKLIIRQHFAKLKKAKVDEINKCVIRSGLVPNNRRGMIAAGLSPKKNCPQFANQGLQIVDGKIGFKFCAIRFEDAEYDESCKEVTEEEKQLVVEEAGAEEVIEQEIDEVTQESSMTEETFEEVTTETKTFVEEQQTLAEEGKVTVEETQEVMETKEEFLSETTVETTEYTEEQTTVIEECIEEVEETKEEGGGSGSGSGSKSKSKGKSKGKSKCKGNKGKGKGKGKCKSGSGSGSGSGEEGGEEGEESEYEGEETEETEETEEGGEEGEEGGEETEEEETEETEEGEEGEGGEGCMCICTATCDGGKRRAKRSALLENKAEDTEASLALRQRQYAMRRRQILMARRAMAARRRAALAKRRKTKKTKKTVTRRRTVTRTVTKTKKVKKVKKTTKVTIKKYKYKGKFAYLLVTESKDEVEQCPEDQCNCCDACGEGEGEGSEEESGSGSGSGSKSKSKSGSKSKSKSKGKSSKSKSKSKSKKGSKSGSKSGSK